MSPPRYLLRFDDICPTMNWQVWSRVQRLLQQHQVRPMVAVVPDNQDPVLQVSAPDPRFWEEVRRWQGLGWCIGLHGYQHRTWTRSAGIMGITHHSEFAGVPMRRQEEMIEAGLAVFNQNDVVPALWVAPAHSFDKATLVALGRQGLKTLSDGWFLCPGLDRHGLLWLPQQLWRLRPRPGGVWTVCYHINGWTNRHLATFAADLEAYAGRIGDFDSVVAKYADRKFGLPDWALFVAWRHWFSFKRRVAKAAKA